MKIIAILLVTLLASPVIVAGEVFDRATYVDNTEAPLTFAWDHQEAAEYHEVQVEHYEHKEIVITATVPAPTNQITIHHPRTGHYVYRVRACKSDGVCSEWSDSTNPERATFNGQPKGWWVYRHVSAPGPGRVE